MRAHAIAASHPACPAPTTTTSNCSVNDIPRLNSAPDETLSFILTTWRLIVTHITPPRVPVTWITEFLRYIGGSYCRPGGTMNTAEFLEKLQASIAKYDLLSHPFYRAWSAGELTRDDLREYARHYYHHVEAFPCYLAAFALRLMKVNCVAPSWPTCVTRRAPLQNRIKIRCRIRNSGWILPKAWAPGAK